MSEATISAEVSGGGAAIAAIATEAEGSPPFRASQFQDAAAHYRNVIGGFTETIRLSDFKANVAIVFTGIMMGPVVAFKDKFPHFVPLGSGAGAVPADASCACSSASIRATGARAACIS